MRSTVRRRAHLAALFFIVSATNACTASAQVADSARVGAASSQATHWSAATRSDTAMTLVPTSHVPRYKLLGLAMGAASGVAFDLVLLAQCSSETHSDGPPSCLGLPIVAPLALFVGALGGTVAGWIVGAAVDAAQR